MDPYQITFETWNKVAALYQEKFMDLDLYNESYNMFCRLITKKNAGILEIGCGPGNITKYMVAARPDFKITAVDISKNMIDLARINNPTVNCKVMDCRNLKNIKGKFDGIICGFCIPYLSKDDTYQLLQDCAALLNPGGFLYFSTIKGDYAQSGFEAASTGDRTYVYYYNETHFLDELVKYGFTLINLGEVDFPKANGRNQINQIFIAQKN
jgi:2-polyprenyl-3-methyl-5-hydroxy-6-metoxy-1,4-benzoquinol methylase